jgi:DNA polymerase I-like protein with 3'-5' exonuclease and polymerase domains
MIQLDDNKFLVQEISDLPTFIVGCKYLYLDVETQANTRGIKAGDILSYDEDETDDLSPEAYSGLYPFKGDRICGFSVTCDDHPYAYYIPMRHSDGKNIPLPAAQLFLKHLVTKCQVWVNHNIIIDAVFAHFEGATFGCELYCTLTASKMHDTDRWGYGQKVLEADWLNRDREDRQRIEQYLKAIKSKNWADVPVDLMGFYGGEDVLGNRLLHKFLDLHRPAEMNPVWETEKKLTQVFFDMELEGLRIEPKEIRLQQLNCLHNMIRLHDEISELSGIEFTNSSACMQEMLFNQFGLPILVTKKERQKIGGRWKEVDTGRPTFDKFAMSVYSNHPLITTNDKLRRLMSAVLEYRGFSQFKGLFLDPFSVFADETNHIHPTYNQIVRTGRTSCKRPNAQQLNTLAKMLIKCEDGEGFFVCDYSQIEFRLMIDYIEDQQAIKAYNENPNTDFHQWVADSLHIKRKPAKTLNFAMGYGAGKAKVTANLISNPDVIAEINEQVTEMLQKGDIAATQTQKVFNIMCAERASEMYELYHETLPGIKSESKKVERICRGRGYVCNRHKRRRYLPREAAHKAFNTIVQGEAMDCMKERIVAFSPRFNSDTKKWGMRLAANVHDANVIKAPWEVCKDPTAQQFIADVMENPEIKYSVPIKIGMGISRRHWAEADYEDKDFEKLKISNMDDGVKIGKIR